MAEFFSMSMLTGPAKEAFAEMDRVTDKSTRYAVRAGGRLIARKAKADLAGKMGGRGYKISTGKTKKGRVYQFIDQRAAIESGNLYKSISNSRAMVHLGTGDYSIKVGPFGRAAKGSEVVRHGTRNGQHIDSRTAKHLKLKKMTAKESSKGQVRGVPLYRKKLEAKYGFVAAGVTGSETEIRKVYEEAMAKAYERFK